MSELIHLLVKVINLFYVLANYMLFQLYISWIPLVNLKEPDNENIVFHSKYLLSSVSMNWIEPLNFNNLIGFYVSRYIQKKALLLLLLLLVLYEMMFMLFGHEEVLFFKCLIAWVFFWCGDVYWGGREGYDMLVDYSVCRVGVVCCGWFEKFVCDSCVGGCCCLFRVECLYCYP